jgi:hypothetical protein
MSQLGLNTLLAQANKPGGLDGFADKATKAVMEPADKARETFGEVFDQILALVPGILGMFAILIIGYLLAHFLGKLAATLCEKVGLQRAAERSGLAESMKQVGIQRSVPSIVGLILFMLIGWNRLPQRRIESHRRLLDEFKHVRNRFILHQ